MAQYTLSFSEKNNGWGQFWSFIPDWFARLGKRFYTIKNGQLWIHNDTDNPVMNNFYGVQYNTSIKTVFNDAMADDKAFRTINTESPQKWDAFLKTNYTESTIKASEFNTRESRQFSFIRQNENVEDLSGGAAQGIGVISSVAGNVITMNGQTSFVSTGDILKQVNGAVNEIIGTVTLVNGDDITVNAVTTAPVPGYFSFAQKNARVEGSNMRGYFLEVTLVNTDTVQGELFAINTEASKSNV